MYLSLECKNSSIGIGVLLDLKENRLHGSDNKSASKHRPTVPDEKHHMLETARSDGVVIHIGPVVDERYQQKTREGINNLHECQVQRGR